MLTNSNLLLGKSYIPPQKIISEDMMYLCDLVNAFYFYVRDWEILAHKDANYSAWRCYAKIRKLLGLPGLKVPRSSALPGNLHLEAFNELASISKRYSMEYNLDDYKKNADINGRSIKVVPDESLYLRPEIDPKTVIMTQSMFNMYAIFCRPTLAARYFNNRILNTTCDKLLAIHLLMRNKKLLDKTKTNFFQPEEDGVTKLEYEFNKNKEFLFNILELDIRPEVREQVKGVVKKLSQSEVSICTKIHVLAAQFLILHHCIMEDSSSQLRSDFLRVFQNT
jgi:ribosomal protein S6